MLLALAAPNFAPIAVRSALPIEQLQECMVNAWGRAGLRATSSKFGSGVEIAVDFKKVLHPLNDPAPFWIARIADEGERRLITIGWYRTSVEKDAPKILRKVAGKCIPDAEEVPAAP